MYGFDFAALAPLEKGWSGDRKYRARGRDGREYVLRVSPAAKREQRARCFALMRRAWESGVPMCEPVACGECDEGAYTLLGWVEGEDAEAALARMDADAQYAMAAKPGVSCRRFTRSPHRRTRSRGRRAITASSTGKSRFTANVPCSMKARSGLSSLLRRTGGCLQTGRRHGSTAITTLAI